MAKILAIVWQDLLVFLKQRSNLPSLVITPVVMTVLIALVDTGAFSSAPVQRLDIIDHDRTQSTANLLAAVREANPDLTLCPIDNTAADPCSLGKGGTLTQSQALDRVANGTSLGLLEIPAGFGADVAAQQPVSLAFHSSGSFGASQPAEQAVQEALAQINSAVTASQVGLTVMGQLQGQAPAGNASQDIRTALYQRALQMEKGNGVTTELALSDTGQKHTMAEHLHQGLGQSVPGMGTMFVLMTIFGGMSALIIERQQWTLQRLATMPMSRGTLLAGKIVARFCLGLLQFLVVFAVGAVLGMDFGQDPFALLLLTVVYILAITALSFAIGSGLKNPAQAAGLGLILTLTLAPLGGAWWPMDISPKFLQVIGHASPVAWAMDGFTALTYNGAHLVDILIPLAVLAGMTAAAFLIAIPRFRYEVD